MYQWAFERTMARFEADERTEDEKQASEELDARLYGEDEWECSQRCPQCGGWFDGNEGQCPECEGIEPL